MRKALFKVLPIHILFNRKNGIRLVKYKIFEILISLILLVAGIITMLPGVPQENDGFRDFLCEIYTESEDIAFINLKSMYSSYNDNRLLITAYCNAALTEDTTITFIFPKRSKVSRDDRIGYTTYVNNIDDKCYANVKLPAGSATYTFAFLGRFFYDLTDSSQYSYVKIQNEKEIPIEYEFYSPDFSSVEISGTQPNYKEDAMAWQNVGKEGIFSPTVIKITTPELLKREQKKIIIGTILLTIGLSFMIEIVFGFIDTLRNRYLEKENSK